MRVPTIVSECDIAVLGAGPDGLAAAALLARHGTRVVVIEGSERPGGRAITREFYPGFRASPFQDELAPIPAGLHWALGLAARGVLTLPTRTSAAVWPDKQHVFLSEDYFGCSRLIANANKRAGDAILTAGKASAAGGLWPTLFRSAVEPADEWMWRSISEVAGEYARDSAEAAHMAAHALAGRAADPCIAGSALHFLAPAIGSSEMVAGGLGRLTDALVSAAKGAGTEVRCGLPASEIQYSASRIRGVVLADGTRIKARAVISTLDLKRTFFSLLRSADLPKSVATRIANFRSYGTTARILFALSLPPQGFAPEALRAPIHVAPDMANLRNAYAAWRVRQIPAMPPIALRCVSAFDRSLCPAGAATLTATIGCVPYRLADGPWSHDRRDRLRAMCVAWIGRVLPGFSNSILGCEVLVPPDFEQQIEFAEGDLLGGEIAADQMFDMRPGLEPASPRTFLHGLYLAGPSTPAGPLATCASGAIAARAVLTDFKRGWFR